MAQGKNHDRINLIVGTVLASLLWISLKSFLLLGFFSSGWLFSTFIFSPDSDFMPKKRAGILRFVLYPYALLFKHRGVSHSFIWGTLTRLIYLILMTFLGIFVLSKMDYLKTNHEDFLAIILDIIRNFNLENPFYLAMVWLYLGMFGADFTHVLTDKVSTFLKKLLP